MPEFIYVMRFRKPWLRVKLVDFDFSAKLLSSDYNESNKPNIKFLTRIRSEKSLVELSVPITELFHFFYIFHFTQKFTFHSEPWLM